VGPIWAYWCAISSAAHVVIETLIGTISRAVVEELDTSLCPPCVPAAPAGFRPALAAK